ncbi:ATP-binding protein [Alkalibacillus salilacus]|uniref:histidine kinase n=1 Tax=Alkalibacillus salilacus TaxID=284582 RepID=A0ABT9VB68_9BACI|nr:sensor histidine kinase [Alkalibacillus salilacus]MDQ0158211.1 CitB family two-component system sensor histidine kinase CitS [Alkalibacillus salilacus]
MLKKVSLRTKILTSVISLLLIVTVFITGVYSYIEWNQTKDQMGQRALDVATSISLTPEVIEAFDDENPSETIQPIAESIREQVGAEFIVVGNKDSIRYSHPLEERIGKRMVGGDNDQALIDEEYYTSEAVGSLGPSLRGKAPIFNDQDEVIGLVSVGFMIEDIRSVIFSRLQIVFIIATIILGVGIVGSIALTRSIRDDILGLEPHEIVNFYRERKAVLRSVKEGIIAIDGDGYITIMNHSAREMLDLSEDMKYQHINDILPNTKMLDVLHQGEAVYDDEMMLKDRVYIVNRMPILEEGEVVGAVASFRDRTELQGMINTLSEVKRYSEDLRAQTHEYTNKLHVLSGLLQLGHYDEAINMIQEESKQHHQQTKTLFSSIEDQAVQAILLGKLGKASEQKVNLAIDPASTCAPLPAHVSTSKLVTILGNLIDNAFEAVQNQNDPHVTFSVLDYGRDVIFEISDNGPGIPIDEQQTIFDKGFSTKDYDHDRGYGLSVVDEVVNELDGSIELSSQIGQGTVFTVYIPKESR